MKPKYNFILFSLTLLITGIGIGLVIPSVMEHSTAVTKSNDKALLQEGEFSSQINIVAVTSRGTGLVSQAEVEIREGEGRVLFNVNPFVEPDTQYSAETAKFVAEEFTGKNCSQKDVIYTVKAGESRLVGGPSAGAALALGTIAAIQEKEIRKDIAITGTIQQNGSIGQVGGIMEKARAAAQEGINLFLVPRGQSTGIFYEQKTQEKKGRGFVFKRVYYEPVEIDLNKAFFEEYGMQIREVTSIEEAVQYALK